MSKKLNLTALLVFFVTNFPQAFGDGVIPGALQNKTRLTQHGITWIFDKAVLVGKFVNGDYYVIGPATVSSMEPRPLFGREIHESEIGSKEKRNVPAALFLRNGSMINPPATQVVSFDSGIRNFFDHTLAVKLPMTLMPGDTLVSTISLQAGESISFPFGATKGSREHRDNSPVKSAAILTCVKEPLPADAFRPSYGDRSQKIYYARDLKRHLLPKLKKPAKVPDLAMLLRALERPWVNPGFFGFEQPMENMPHYGQSIVRVQSMAALMLLLDLPDQSREALLIRFVQIGIDYWGLVRNGHPGWQGWGGHGSGRKIPIVLSGLLLGDAEMAAPTKTFPKVEFGEDNQTMNGRGWTGATALFAGHSGIQSASGKAERPQWGPYEHLHPRDWTPTNLQSESYRRANTSSSWVGQALAIRLLRAEKQWNHDPFLEYVDRWMTEDDREHRAVIMEFHPTAPLTDRSRFAKQGFTWDPFVKSMWDLYRFAPIEGKTNP